MSEAAADPDPGDENCAGSDDVVAAFEAILAGAPPAEQLAPLGAAQRAELEQVLAARAAILRDGGSRLPADRVGPFRLRSLLGRGGQGAVWLAEDERIPRLVALKILDAPFAANPERLVRFRREAEVAARLEHPAICTIYEVGTTGKAAWLAMRYVEGQTLAQAIADVAAGRAAQRDWLACAEQCARALHVAHEAGIVHRDLKPQNVMLGRDGAPVILDFGLAEDARDSSDRLTHEGQVIGTPAYLAPEWISAASGRPDRRSDVWSLAATFYEAITLRAPFAAPTREALYRAILETEPVPIQRLRPDLPRELGTVFAVALTRSLDHRYQSALDFAEDLRRVRVREPILARPVPVRLRAWRWLQRHRLLASVSVGAFVAVVAALVVTLAAWLRTEQALDRSQARLQLTEAQLLAERDPGAALRQWLSLADAAPRAVVNEAVLKLLERSDELGALEGHDGRVRDVAWSADGKWLATACADGVVRVFEAERRSLLHALRLPSPAGALAFLADRRLVIGDDAGSIQVLAPGTPATARRFVAANAAIQSLALAGDEVVMGSADGTVAGFDLRTGAATRRLGRLPAPVTRVALTRSTGLVLAAALDGCVHVWHEDGSERTPLRHQLNEVNDLAVSGDDRFVATASNDNRVWLFDLSSEGLAPLELHGHESAVYSVAFQPGGNGLASGSFDRNVLVWNLRNCQSPARIRVHSKPVRRVAYSPDGARLVSAAEDGGVRLWRAGPRPGIATLRHGDHLVASARFDPAGQRVVTVSRALGARIWSVDRGELLRKLDTDAPVTDACYAPDGRQLAVAAADRTVRLHDAVSGATLRCLTLPEPEEGSAALPDDPNVTWSPDGRLLLASSRVGPAAVYAADTGRLLYPLRAVSRFYSTGTVARAAFDAETRWLAVVRPDGKEDVVVIHRASDGAVLATIARHASFVESVAFAPRGDRLVTASADGTAVVFAWNGAEATPVAELRGHSGCVLDAQFAPDGARVLTAGMDGTARVWHAGDGVCQFVLTGHEGMLYSARFAADGARILAASWDHTASLWDAASGELLLRYGSHDRALLCAEWSPDGSLVVTSANDGTARIWPSDPLAYARGH